MRIEKATLRQRLERALTDSARVRDETRAMREKVQRARETWQARGRRKTPANMGGHEAQRTRAATHVRERPDESVSHSLVVARLDLDPEELVPPAQAREELGGVTERTFRRWVSVYGLTRYGSRYNRLYRRGDLIDLLERLGREEA